MYIWMYAHVHVCVYTFIWVRIFHIHVNVLLHMKTTFVVAKAEKKESQTQPTTPVKHKKEWGTQVLNVLRTGMVHVHVG